MKIFGKDLFDYKKPIESMYDFAQHGILNSVDIGFFEQYQASTIDSSSTASSRTTFVPKPIPVDKKTPKDLFDAKALHDLKFVIKRDDKYIEEQVQELQEKLNLLGKKKKIKKQDFGGLMAETGGTKFGRDELESMMIRLKNRKKIDAFKTIIDKYPHTTSALVSKVVQDNSHLRCNLANDFVPDMPKDAINAMKEYDKMCQDLCGQKAVFYVVADSTDFQKKNDRRDPILLAQSPFGFFWQILGAWDKEMIYLGDL